MVTAPPPGLWAPSRRPLTGGLVLAVTLVAFEALAVGAALPLVQDDLGGLGLYGWVFSAFQLGNLVGIVLAGRAADARGARAPLAAGLALFAVGLVAGGMAPTMLVLVAARFVQGLGGGAIQALAFAILGDILPPRERGRYIGYFTLAFVGAALLGPLIGGVIIDHWSWPWIFFINIPLAGLASVVSYRALSLPFPRRKARLDIRGAVVLSLTVGALMIGLEEGGNGSWTRPLVIALLAAAAGGVVLFVLVERRAVEPMIPLRLFTNPVVLACTIAGMCAGTIAFGAGPFLPLYFQDSLFVSPTESGLRMLPQMIGVTLGTFGIGRLVLWTGRYKAFPVVGTAIAAGGLFAIGHISGTTPYAWLLAPMVAMGFGMAAVFTTTSIATQNAVEFQDLGVATATIMFFRSLGGSFGLAVFGTILNSTIRSEIPTRLDITPDAAADLIREPGDIRALPAASRSAVVDALALGVGRIYLVCAGVMIVGLIAAALLPERPLRSRAGLSDAMEERAAATATA